MARTKQAEKKEVVSPTRYKMISPVDESILGYVCVMPDKLDEHNLCYVVYSHALENVISTRCDYELVLRNKYYVATDHVPQVLEDKIMEVLR